MAFHTSLTIPVSTTISAPADIILPLSPLLVQEVDITFPNGCVGLVEVWFEYRSRQIWPLNSDGRFIGNGQTVRFRPNFPIDKPPYELLIRGINSDDTFPHTVYILVDGELPRGVLAQFVDSLLGGSGRNIPIADNME